MRNYEKALFYICLIFGTLISLITLGGQSYFEKGEWLRGLLFAGIAILSVAGWVGPLIPAFRTKSQWIARVLISLVFAVYLYDLLRRAFAPDWPPIFP